MSTPKPANKKGNNVAAVHTGGMRNEVKNRKVVYKNVLDTPFNIPWPEVTVENNTIVLDMLCDLLKPIRAYRRTRPDVLSKKDVKERKVANRQSKDASSKKNSIFKPNTALASVDKDVEKPLEEPITTEAPISTSSSTAATTASVPTTSSKTQSAAVPISKPEILSYACFGINAVTKELEKSIQDMRDHPPFSAVFVCKADLQPAHLYAHLGPMVAMLPGTILFPLVRGSERKLSEALGVPAVGALGIKAGSKDAEDLIMILGRMVNPIEVSWLPKVAAPPLVHPKPERKKVPAKSTTAAGVIAAAEESGPSPMEISSTLTATTTTTTAMVSSETNTTTAAAAVMERSTVTTTTSKATSSTTKTTTATTAVSSSSSSKKKKTGEWIPTNIKTIQTTMPIVVRKPKVVESGDSGNNKNGSNTHSNKNNNSPSSSKNNRTNNKVDEGSNSNHGGDTNNQKNQRKHGVEGQESSGKGKKPKNS